MQAIRKFQEEREVWEVERAGLEEQCRKEGSRREEVEQQLAALSAEVERLRAAQSGGAPAEAGPRQGGSAELVRTHHEKQLALMTTIDGLRGELQQEQARARALEKRAAQAEFAMRTPSGESDLDCTRAGSSGLRRGVSGGLDGTGDSLRRSLEKKREEVRTLEDEALRLREELNSEKKKVVELKKAAHTRGAAWKEQLEQITEELTMKQRLEEENAHLRLEQARFRKELSALTEREAGARREADQMRREVLEARAAKKDAHVEVAEKMEEMEILSTVVGGQLVAVEQELTQQVQKSSQLLELFLRHVLHPLATIRRCCEQLVGELGREGCTDQLCKKQAPPVCEANVHDLKVNLVKIVNLLRYAAEVLEAHEQWQQAQPETSDGAVSPPMEESSDFARSWFKGLLLA